MTNSPLDQEKQRIVDQIYIETGELYLDHVKNILVGIADSEGNREKIQNVISARLDVLNVAVLRELGEKVRGLRPDARTLATAEVVGGSYPDQVVGYDMAIDHVLALLSAPNKDKEE